MRCGSCSHGSGQVFSMSKRRCFFACTSRVLVSLLCQENKQTNLVLLQPAIGPIIKKRISRPSQQIQVSVLLLEREKENNWCPTLAESVSVLHLKTAIRVRADYCRTRATSNEWSRVTLILSRQTMLNNGEEEDDTRI